MRTLIVLLFALGVSLIGVCQSEVKWSIMCEKLNDQEYKLQVRAVMDKGWYIYAQGEEGIKIELSNANIKAAPLSFDHVIIVKDKLLDKTVSVVKDSLLLSQELIMSGTVPNRFDVHVSGFISDGESFLSVNETRNIVLKEEAKIAVINTQPLSGCGQRMETGSYWSLFLKGIAGGLLALLMPCIFPLLPVTVSYFMNKSDSKRQAVRNGSLYGFFIFLIYLLAAIPFHIAGNANPGVFNALSTNAYVNMVFFCIFVVFALSLFGCINIQLPGANMAGSKPGIFFMALTLVIVSFSCTGPILGFLLVNSINESSGAWALTAGLAGFGLALALPFGLFAMFPGWLKKLPKSGSWMETLKKSLAFVELALAIKFLSNADLVEHWGIVKREIFIGAWIVIAILLALYLFGIFDKKNVSKLRVASKGNFVSRPPYPKIIFGVLAGLFALYLCTGLLGNSLKYLSGFPPPRSYSLFKRKQVIEPDVINDYDKALALAKKLNKPLLIDFTGWACINCRKMEEQVWTRPEITDIIKEKYVLVSLYVDDRKQLPEGGTVGDKWAKFQADHFGSVAQPQYVLVSPGGQLLNYPVGYSGVNEYREWLECGIDAFRKKDL